MPLQLNASHKELNLDHIMKFGRDFVINQTPWTTLATNKWQGYLPGEQQVLLVTNLGSSLVNQGSKLHVVHLGQGGRGQ